MLRFLLLCGLSVLLPLVLFVSSGLTVAPVREVPRESMASLVSRTRQVIARHEQIENELLQLAKNEDLDIKTRRHAVLALDQHGGRKALTFLVDEISLELDIKSVFNFNSDDKYACRLALGKYSNYGWDLPKAILDQCDGKLSAHEVLAYSPPLGAIGQTELVRKVLANELAKRPHERRKRNLKSLQQFYRD